MRPIFLPDRAVRGSSVVYLGLLAAVVALALLLALGGHERASRAARSQAAADAVALAIAGDGESAGRAIAARNDAVIITAVHDGPTVRVVVEHHGMRRSATAIWELAWLPPALAP